MARWLLLCILLSGALAPAWCLTSVTVQDFETDGYKPTFWGVAYQPDNAVKVVNTAPFSGQRCLKLHYNFADIPDNSYLGIPIPVKIPVPIHKVIVALRGDNSRCQLGIQVTDASGETHQFHAGVVDFSGWHDVIVDTDLPHETWGGNQNGKMDYPITAVTLIVHSPVQLPAVGNLCFDALRVEADRKFSVNTGGAAGPLTKVLVQDYETPESLPSVWGVWTPPDNAVSLSKDDPYSGKQSLKLHYVFTPRKGEEYLGIPNTLRILAPVHTLSIAVKGDNSRCGLGVQVHDASNETHQYRLGTVDFRGWKVLNVNLDNGHETWGGDNNGTIDYPISDITLTVSPPPRKDDGSFVADTAETTPAIDPDTKPDEGDAPLKPKQVNAVGDLYYDAISVESEKPAENTVFLIPKGAKDAFVDGVFYAVFSPTKGRGYFWGPDDAPALDVWMSNQTDTEMPAELTVRLADHHGHALGEVWTQKPTIAGNGIFHQIVPLKVPRFGVYDVEIAAGSTTRHLTICWLSTKATPWIDGPFGVCTHFGQFKHPDIPWTATTIHDAGIAWVRDGANLSVDDKGELSLPPSTKLYLDALKANNLQLLSVMLGNPLSHDPLAPKTDDARALYIRLLQWNITHLRDYGRAFEIWNEPDGDFWKPRANPTDYAALVNATYPELKKSEDGKKATILIGSVSWFNWGFIDPLLKSGAAANMDVFALHPYGLPGAPDSAGLQEKLDQLRTRLDDAGAKEHDVWITEFGYVTQPPLGGVTPDVAATYIVREYLLALARPRVKRLFYYDFQDDGDNPRDNECNFGLLKIDGSAKPGYAAYNTMARLLDRKVYTRNLAQADASQCEEFTGDGGKTLAAWAPEGAGTLACSVTTKAVTVTDLMGNATRISAIAGRITIPLTAEPLFVTDYGVAAVAAPLVTVGGMVKATCGTPVQVTLTADPAFNGAAWQLHYPAGWKITPVEGKPLSWTLTVPPATTQGRDYALVLATDTGMGTGVQVAVSDPLEIHTALTAANTVTLTLANPFPAAVKGAYQVSQGEAESPEVPVEVAGGKTIEVAIPVHSETDAGVSSVPVDVTVRVGDAWQRFFRTVGGFTPCYPVKGPIDADPAKWAGHKPCLLNAPFQVTSLNLGGATWGGLDDLSARFWLGNDTTNLDLAVMVRDKNQVQTHDAEGMWMADCVQFALAIADKRYEFGIGLHNDGTALVFQWSPADAKVPAEKIIAVAKRVGDETHYEIAIPWAALGITPGATPFRFALVINDDDGNGRRQWIEWFPGIAKGKLPALYAPVLWAP